ncbi:hypothetical protein MHU86_11706 [Fragilaria crotonensis]|nr:hypothetical protein MHU86_11706 [Fragilaria crotonensis]
MDDDMKDGDGDKLDTKGLLKRLLSFEKHDAATDTDTVTDATTPNESQTPETIAAPRGNVLTEHADSLTIDSRPVEEMEPLSTVDVQSDDNGGADDENDDELFHDEHDETYAALDAVDPPKRNERQNREDHRNIDPTESENYGGMEVDEIVPGEGGTNRGTR